MNLNPGLIRIKKWFRTFKISLLGNESGTLFFDIEQFFLISPEYSGYSKKILAYWDIAKKFAFIRVQYFTVCYVCNYIN